MYSQEVENEGAQWFLLSKLKRDLWGVCSICCLMIHAGSKQRVRALDGLIEVRKQSTGDVSELLIRTLCGIGIVSPSPPCCAAHLATQSRHLQHLWCRHLRREPANTEKHFTSDQWAWSLQIATKMFWLMCFSTVKKTLMLLGLFFSFSFSVFVHSNCLKKQKCSIA